MSMNFVALLRYQGPGPELTEALDLLESATLPEIRQLESLLIRRGFSVWDVPLPRWKTRGADESDPPEPARPSLPDLTIRLELPADFILTVGADVIEVFSRVRWASFLEELEVQVGLLDSVAALGRLFRATDCIVTSDYSPAVQAARKEVGFEEALRRALPGHGEVANLEDLLLCGADYWDSRGYWRFRWSSEIGAGRPWPPRSPRWLPTEAEQPLPEEALAELLEGLLHDLRYEVRRKQEKAAGTLAELGPAARRAIPDLLEATTKRWPSVRVLVACALGCVGKEAPVRKALQTMAEGDVEEVWYAAIRSLGRIGAAAIPELTSLLRHSDPNRRQNAAYTLGSIGPAMRQAVPAMLAALSDNDTKTRQDIADAISLIGAGADHVSAIVAHLHDSEDLVRLWLVRTLVDLGPEAAPALPALLDLLEDPSEMVRSSASWALNVIGPETTALVIQRLHSPSPQTRAAAADAVGRMRSRDAREELKTTCSDPDEMVRQRSGDALRRLDSIAGLANWPTSVSR